MEKKSKITIIFIVLGLLTFFGVRTVDAASLYFFPSAGSYNIGQGFSVTVNVGSSTQAINAVSGVIFFPQDKLEVISLSKSGSIFNLWVQEPSFSNNTGTVNLEGIVLNPGFIGSKGTVITMSFKVKAAGKADLSFSSASVLANDGKGTNILTSLGDAQFNLGTSTVPQVPESPIFKPATGFSAKPVVSSDNCPNDWCSNKNPEFSWELPSDVTDVSLLLHKKPDANPGSISDGLIESKKFENIEKGKWYFHIKFKNKQGWGEITNRNIFIDIEPPEPFEIEVKRENSTDPRPTLYFESSDKLSGLKHYEIKIGEGNDFLISSDDIVHKNPYKMPIQAPGKHVVIVKALDKAGNSSTSTADIIIEPLETPVITEIAETLKTGEVLTVKGTSLYPNALVAVFIGREGGEVESGEVEIDNEGNWSFIYDKELKKGTYKVWAEIINNKGAKSYQTEKITIEVSLPIFIKFGKIAVEYLTIMTTLIALIIFLIVIIVYAGYRIGLWKKRLRKETKEVETSVIAAFRALREEVQEQVEYLDKKKGLSTREKKIRDELEEALNVSEKFITKEIRDVEKELE